MRFPGGVDPEDLARIVLAAVLQNGTVKYHAGELRPLGSSKQRGITCWEGTAVPTLPRGLERA
jgi:hypothetical protein